MYPSTLLVEKLTRNIMIAQGDFDNVRVRRVYAIVVIGGASILLFGSVIGFLTAGSGVIDKLTALATVSLMFFALLNAIQVSDRREKIRKLLLKMEDKDDSRHHVLRYADTMVKKKLIWHLLTMMLGFGLTPMQIIIQSFQNIPITAKYSLLVPFWFSCGDNGNETRLLEIPCYTVRTKGELLLINVILSLLGALIAIQFIGAVILYGVIIYELSAHVNIFKSKIHATTKSMNRQYLLKLDQETADKRRTWQRQPIRERKVDFVNEHLIPLIEYQQFLKSCIGSIVDTWTAYSSNIVINHFIILSTVVYTVVMERNNAILLAFRAAAAMVFTTVIFSSVCWYGYYISQLNEVIFDELLTIPWYQQNAKFRKLYGIMLTLNRRSNSIRIFDVPIYEIGLRTMESIMRTTYSALNLIILMLNK